MHIAKASLTDPEVRQLVELHQRDMHASSPPGTSFALDVRGLADASITLLGAWDDRAGGRNQLVGIAALKRLSAHEAEIKSMRTDPDHLGKGIGTALLEALIAEARSSAYVRLSLESGTSEQFAPAIDLYSRHGFIAGDGFANYRNGAHNQCYHLNLRDLPA